MSLSSLFFFKGSPRRFERPGSRFDAGTGFDGSRIKCPLCAWAPGKDDRWVCSCDFIWNTFDTGGRCPACDFQWAETMCLRCRQWSPHAEWYVDPEP